MAKVPRGSKGTVKSFLIQRLPFPELTNRGVNK